MFRQFVSTTWPLKTLFMVKWLFDPSSWGTWAFGFCDCLSCRQFFETVEVLLAALPFTFLQILASTLCRNQVGWFFRATDSGPCFRWVIHRNAAFSAVLLLVIKQHVPSLSSRLGECYTSEWHPQFLRPSLVTSSSRAFFSTSSWGMISFRIFVSEYSSRLLSVFFSTSLLEE